MNPRRFQRLMRGELGKLRREQLIDGQTYDQLLALYPATRWDYAALGRWFLIFGAVSAAAGVLILGSALFELTLRTLAFALTLLAMVCAAFSWRMRNSSLLWTRRSIELLGGITLIGLTMTLGAIYSTGSGNWPALLLIDLIVLVPFAYIARNILLLTLAVVVFFTWFGGVTGYASGWGMYWFGMNYPLRFLLVGLIMTGLGALHWRAERNWRRAYDGFFKVWLAGGLFFSEMALWLMSLFGNYGRIFDEFIERPGQLLLFNALWATFNLISLNVSRRSGIRMLRGFSVTFLVIQGYTLYFWKVAGHLGAILATFVAGAVTLALVVRLESRRRNAAEARQ